MSSSIPANNATNRFNNEIKREEKNTINNKISHLNSYGESKIVFSMQRNRCILKMRNPPNTCILWDVWLKKCEICRHLFLWCISFFQIAFQYDCFQTNVAVAFVFANASLFIFHTFVGVILIYTFEKLWLSFNLKK